MKIIKLTKLLGKITRLPWTTKTNTLQGTYDQIKFNLIYKRHAANHLPELVDKASAVCLEAERDIWHPDKMRQLCDELRAAVIRAEKVKMDA